METQNSPSSLERTPTVPLTSPEPATPPEPLSTKAMADELRRGYATLAELYTAGARLSAVLQWEPLLEQILTTALNLVCGDGASLTLVDDSREDLYLAAATHLPATVIQNTRLLPGEGLPGWVIQHREAVLLNGPLDPQRYPKSLAKADAIGSVLSTPLIPPPLGTKVQSVVGALNVHRQITHPPFVQDELEVLTALSTQAAIALQNARLYQQLQLRHTQLETLTEISRTLAATLDMDAVLHLIIQKAMALLDCQAASLLLVDPAQRELVVQVALGLGGPTWSNKRLPLDAGFAGYVVRTGQPLSVDDAQNDPRYDHLVESSIEQPIRSLLCVPLVKTDQVFGVLQVMNKKNGAAFSDADRDSLTAFALQSTLALENARLYSELKQGFTDTVRVITNAIEARDPYTAGHSDRVNKIAQEIGRELGWPRERIEILEIGAILHDIGKIGVSDSILHKPGELTREEYADMKQHPIVGAKVLEQVHALRPILPYILYHQEHFDGGGYPFGLAGSAIPIEGRLLAVVDAFDAMISDRFYRMGMTIHQALEELLRHRGTQFDPEIVDALVRVASSGRLAFLAEYNIQ